MRHLVTAVVLLSAGCQGLVGPRQRALNPEPVANPCLSTGERLSVGEQMRRSRDQLAFPEANYTAGPRTYAEIPNATGR